MTPQSPDIFSPLPKEEVIKAVERRGPRRIPLVVAKWWGEGLHAQYGERLREFDRFPEDVRWLWMPNPVDPAAMNLSWQWAAEGGLDARAIIDDWAKLDEFIEKLPVPDKDPRFDAVAAGADAARASGMYVMFAWWNLFFERPWVLRGMQNLLMDYADAPDQVHRMHDALCRTYIAYIRKAAEVCHPDGLWTSDDLGHQKGPMMGPGVFRELILPYYSRVGAALRECGMHFWLHSCGDNTKLLPMLAQGGVTVFHPVQKHTMDERAVAAEFGGRLSFLAGIDVQHTLQEGTPDDVRAEVRFLIDTFDRPDGGMCIAAGNGIVGGTPFENIEAFLDEAVRYGQQHRAG